MILNHELTRYLDVDNDKYPTPLEFDCNYICEDDKGCYDYCLKTHADYQRMPEYVVPEYVMPEYVAPARAIPAQPYRVSAPTSVKAAPTSVRAAPTARVATTAPAAAPAAASASTKATVAPKKAQ